MDVKRPRAPAQVGVFTSCYGATQILSGRLAALTIPILGGTKFTALAHASMVCAWVLLGRARSLAGVALALAVSLPWWVSPLWIEHYPSSHTCIVLPSYTSHLTNS